MTRGYQTIKPWGAILLFAPWAVASLLTSSPSASWWAAWLGSWGIFVWVWTGRAGGIDASVPLKLRILNPVFLVHGIFAGYGFMTAVFYWLELSGGIPLGRAGLPFAGTLATAAQAQRYYALAHASLAFGLILGSRPRCRNPVRWNIRGSLSGLLLSIATGAGLAGILVGYLPGLSQLRGAFAHLSLVACAMSLGTSLTPEGRRWLPVSASMNGFLIAAALASGFKEELLVMILLIGVGTFPIFPKTTLFFGAAVFIGSLTILPVLSRLVRQEVWEEGRGKWEGLNSALDILRTMTLQEVVEIDRRFLTQRFSEIGMFVTYIESVDGGTPREGTAILKQLLLAPVPRILWKGKPDLEKQVMERVYAHGVVSENSSVSAKPHPVTDGYLLGGGLGVCLSFGFIGLMASLCYSFCDSCFGGVFLGGVFFNGLFSVLWRGNAFEFMFSSLVWGYFAALGLSWALQYLGWTKREPAEEAQWRHMARNLTGPEQKWPLG